MEHLQDRLSLDISMHIMHVCVCMHHVQYRAPALFSLRLRISCAIYHKHEVRQYLHRIQIQIFQLRWFHHYCSDSFFSDCNFRRPIIFHYILHRYSALGQSMSMSPTLSSAFDEALLRFKQDLPDHERRDFAIASVEDVYDEIRKIQEWQGKQGLLRNLRRIEPYINGLTQFSKVIEVFVQAKPEIMAFIWVCS